MRYSVPITLGLSAKATRENQEAIGPNTYRAFAISSIASLIMVLALLFVMRALSVPQDIPNVVPPTPIIKIDVGQKDPLVTPPPRVQPPSTNWQTVFAQRIDTTTEQDPSKDQKNQLANNDQSSMANTGTVGTGSSSTMDNTGGSKQNTTGSGQDQGTVDNDDFDQFTEMPEVDPVVNMRDLQAHLRFPDRMQRMGIEGEVHVCVLVGENGAIEKSKVLSSTDESFSQAALNALAQIHAQPATTGGKPMRCWVTIPIVFRLH